MEKENLTPNYSNSHALIIGINQYKIVSPLEYAVNDARAVAAILKDKFEFQPKNVKVLCDNKATHDAILESFLSFSKTESNDRLIVYYAGHGYTLTSRRGEVGYLIPYDGNTLKLETLIRWDDLTRNADLIKAKHILFIMDACYGGLAITRALQPGSSRFLNDMYNRYSRQVITAGKANEVVSDSGGPLPNHSIFTGHLLEGLSGKAAIEDGIITANGLMAYVYRMVGRDRYSNQTPHFGYIDGDGDFIFTGPKNNQTINVKTGEDRLINIPSVFSEESGGEKMTLANTLKDYLSEPKFNIRLRDLVTRSTRELFFMVSEDQFPLQGKFSQETFLETVQKYEDTSIDMLTTEILVSYWGGDKSIDLISLPIKTIANNINPINGSSGFLALRWYPLLLLLYASGISSVASKQYNNLYKLFHLTIKDTYNDKNFYLKTLINEISQLNDDFKWIPGSERLFFPINEHLYKFFQPLFDDLIFLGSDYESVFDEFEIIFGLEFAHLNMKNYNSPWGPKGRFGWKYRGNENANPIQKLITQATIEGTSWPYIEAGFFDHSINRFLEVSTAFTNLLSKSIW